MISSPSSARISSRIPGTTDSSWGGPWSGVNPWLRKLPHRPPRAAPFSTTVTGHPSRARYRAAARPATPPPRTTTGSRSAALRTPPSLLLRHDERLADPVQEGGVIQAGEPHGAGAESPEGTQVGGRPARHVTELERLEERAETDRCETGPPQHLPHRPPVEVVEVHGQEEDPAPPHEPGGQAAVVGIADGQHAARGEELVGPFQHRPGVGRVLDDVPQREQVDTARAHGHVEDRARVELEAVALAREAAHPLAGLAAERLVALL